MKEQIEEIINRNTEGNYLLSNSDKAQIVSEILTLIDNKKSANKTDIYRSFSGSFEVRFSKALKAEINVTNEEVKVLRAVDGWGNPIYTDQCSSYKL